jgi:hypothetical protein
MSALLREDGTVLFIGEADTKEELFDEWLSSDALGVLNELLLRMNETDDPSDLIVVDVEI